VFVLSQHSARTSLLSRPLPCTPAMKSKIQIGLLPGPPRTSFIQSPLSFLPQVLATRQFFFSFSSPGPDLEIVTKEVLKEKGSQGEGRISKRYNRGPCWKENLVWRVRTCLAAPGQQCPLVKTMRSSFYRSFPHYIGIGNFTRGASFSFKISGAAKFWEISPWEILEINLRS